MNIILLFLMMRRMVVLLLMLFSPQIQSAESSSRIMQHLHSQRSFLSTRASSTGTFTPDCLAFTCHGNIFRSKSTRTRMFTKKTNTLIFKSSSSEFDSFSFNSPTDPLNTDPIPNPLNTDPLLIPPFLTSPVLKQVYPALLRHLQEYGNPNIPLGTVDGRNCKTLRRLAFEQKLNEQEIQLLKDMNFRFNSLEEVYEEADFDTCLSRLVQYEQDHDNGFQIPKKYPQDPELGAWVTMIRRIGRDHIPQERREKLDQVGFAWVSSRKCGSSFMTNFRPIKEKLEACCRVNPISGKWEVVNQEGIQAVLKDESILKWLKAQRDAAAKGNLVPARCDYLDQLPGIDWRSLE